MPRGNRTGPDGMGPMTGRGMGFCAGYDQPGFMNGPGGGMGRGRGFGGGGGRRGRRNMVYATGQPGWARSGGWGGVAPAPDPQTEREALGQQAQALQTQLDQIQSRLDALQGEKE